MFNAVRKGSVVLPIMVISATFTAAFAGSCASQALQSNTSLSHNPESAIISDGNRANTLLSGMDQQNTVDVKQGDWGGQGISLVVEKNSATMQFDCANATISSRLRTSKSGKFTATGLWKRSGPGPIRLKFQPKPQEVRFEGEITGKQMKLKITFVETGDVAGEYTLERGKSGRLRRCL